MRKEVFLAVVIGVILGVVILYGINLANKSSLINQNNLESNETSSQNTPTVPQKPDNRVTIIIPTANSVVTENAISLKGTAKPGANIAIISNLDDILTMADNAGNFSSTVNLENGENHLEVTAVDDTLATSSASVYVIRTATLPE